MKKEEVVIDRPSLGSRVFICIIFGIFIMAMVIASIEAICNLPSLQTIIIIVVICGATSLIGFLILCFLTSKLVVEEEQ